MPSITFAHEFNEFVALLLLAAAVGAVALRLRQPVITGFILAGILVGPSGLRWVGTTDEVHLLAELGLAVLLFVVGLRLDIGLVRSMGKVALATGLGQIIFTTIFGYLICLLLGMQALTALYVAVALTFSSTIIIVKLLSDKRETDSLHGRIAIGLLIVQDIVVILIMIALTAIGGNELGWHLMTILGRGMALLAGLGLLMYLVLPRLVGELARSLELLVLFAIAWAVGLASLSEFLGFSKEIGAFLAGVSLASTAYREMLGARLVSLRDFLLLFFFIDLGTRLDIRLLGSQVWGAIPLSLFVLIGNPLIMMIIMGIMGYRRRTSFLSGLLIAQISEFSLILGALGVKLGHIGEETVGLITLVGLITIGLSTYMILYSHVLYDKLSSYLKVFEHKVPYREQSADAFAGAELRPDVILFGLGRYGSNIALDLTRRGRTVMGVDFDPQVVKAWNKAGGIAWFGDAEDPEFPAQLPLSHARWVICSVPNRNTSVCLISALASHGFKGSIGVTAHRSEDVEFLSKMGADIVFKPFVDAAVHAGEMLAAADEQQRRRRMEKTIAAISDHYIVCGYGRMGQQIVEDFRHYRVSHVVVECNPVQIPKLIEREVPYVEGNASEDRVLIAAGIKRAKGLIAVAASDEENVFIVLTARGLNPNLFIVARSILEENEDKLRRAGADRVMSPYILGGHRMAAAVLKPRAMDFLDLLVHTNRLDMEIGDLSVSASSPLVGKSIADSGIRKASGVLILAVKHPNGEITPNPDASYVIHEGDELIVMGTNSQLDMAEKAAARR